MCCFLPTADTKIVGDLASPVCLYGINKEICLPGHILSLFSAFLGNFMGTCYVCHNQTLQEEIK